MTQLRLGASSRLRGEIQVPGDKSISHRALMLGALAEGNSHITGFLNGRDCHATADILQEMGVQIDFLSPTEATVQGVGLHGLQEPHGVLNCDNSGTTMRLMSGILAGQRFTSVLTGTRQLCGRPMGRIVTPLQEMGAHIHGRASGKFAPLTFVPPAHGLTGAEYELPVASAQVKSCLLLAGLFAQGATVVVEPGPTRNHTERILRGMGTDIEAEPGGIHLQVPDSLKPLSMHIPGDISSASFVVLAACLIPDSRVVLPNLGCNETRTGFLEALQAMGASIQWTNRREEGGEPVGDLIAEASELVATEFGGDIIVRMIDELPLLALACTQAHGTSVIRDAQELRVKESDRIDDTVNQLRRLGASLEGTPDGFVICGPTPLQGAEVHSQGDHRLAMMLAVAGLLTQSDVIVHEAQVTADSFPDFAFSLRQLGASILEQNPDA